MDLGRGSDGVMSLLVFLYPHLTPCWTKVTRSCSAFHCQILCSLNNPSVLPNLFGNTVFSAKCSDTPSFPIIVQCFDLVSFESMLEIPFILGCHYDYFGRSSGRNEARHGCKLLSTHRISASKTPVWNINA